MDFFYHLMTRFYSFFIKVFHVFENIVELLVNFIKFLCYFDILDLIAFYSNHLSFRLPIVGSIYLQQSSILLMTVKNCKNLNHFKF